MTEKYTRWANVPGNLKTKTQLKEAGLRPARGQEPVATIRTGYGEWKLYDSTQAVPRQPASPERKAQLATARGKADNLRTCPGYGWNCGEMLTYEDYGYEKRSRIQAALRERGEDISGQEWQYICRFCRDRNRAIRWAREVLADKRAVILDSETTGLDGDAEIIEIAIIRVTGEVLLDTLVKPFGPMGATHIHGIKAEDVAEAPTWPEIDQRFLELAQGASRVIVYNAEFDRQLISQTRNLWQISQLTELEPWQGDILQDPEEAKIPWQCAMEMYAQWAGNWSDHHKSYRWVKLEGGNHRALGDCLACLEYIKRMAESEEIR